MVKFECSGCGGSLRDDGKFYICENCRRKYMIGYDDTGNPFTYTPIEKKEIQKGVMPSKHSKINVQKLIVKDIKLSENIEVEVFKESINISINENLSLISTFLKNKEWDAAQNQINQVLISDSSNAQAHWLGWMCDKKVSNEIELINSFSSFSKNDAIKLDDILSNSISTFAKHIIDLLFKRAYLNDDMCFEIMSVILPYSINKILFDEMDFKNYASNAINITIARVYPKSFNFLLQSTLNEKDVDLYISYMDRFGNRCNPIMAQKYYSEILILDPENLDVNRKLVKSDIKADADVKKITIDFENLLKYSKNTDADVIEILQYVNESKTTTENISMFVWSLLGYYSSKLEDLKAYIYNFSKVLLQSSLWNDAKKYLYLILSFDAHSAYAYWLLCLARINARTEDEIKSKKQKLIDYQEFKKALALYQSAGNEHYVNKLMEFTKKQNTYKKTKITLICIGIGLIIGIILYNVFILLVNMYY